MAPAALLRPHHVHPPRLRDGLDEPRRPGVERAPLEVALEKPAHLHGRCLGHPGQPLERERGHEQPQHVGVLHQCDTPLRHVPPRLSPQPPAEEEVTTPAGRDFAFLRGKGWRFAE